jgi:Bacterial regulatory helix-turn-helix protein, lysR family
MRRPRARIAATIDLEAPPHAANVDEVASGHFGHEARGWPQIMFPSTFRRLEVFIAVVEAGGFIAGAKRLGISHPSISNHVKALERQVGCKLM